VKAKPRLCRSRPRAVALATVIATALVVVLHAVCPAQVMKLRRNDYRPYEGVPITAVTITGNNVTKEYVITREIQSTVGEPYNYEVMTADIVRLTNLGIFTSIVVTPTESEGGVALDYRVRELPWIIPYLKFKYTETDGWSIGPTVSSVNIYLTGFILFGGATTYSVQSIWPWITGNHISVDLLWQRLERENIFYDFNEVNDEFTPWIGSYIGEHGRIAGTFSYFGMESDVDGKTLDPDNRDNMFRLGARIGYDSRDNWQNPMRGWQTELQFLKTGGFLGGDGDFKTTVIDLRRYQPTFKRQTLTLGVLTTLQAGEVGTEIPVYMQYNLGGSNTIRGHDIDGLGQELYGKNEFIATMEYDFVIVPITEHTIFKWAYTLGIEATLFADTGIAWSDRHDLTSGRFKSGFGVGLRALVPAVDLVRLDLGFNLQGDVKFHFGLWPKFDAQRLRIR
jgi:outer membrane protein assembly factor BamA